jgi:hypothetical protein
MSASPSAGTPRIVLCTLNARFIHASLGLRYLLANMGELRACTALREFTVASRPADVVASLLQTLGDSPAELSSRDVYVVGFGVYVWNVEATLAVLRLLRQERPELRVVLGGPEVSHELDAQPIVALADHVITGRGEVSFPELCRALLDGKATPAKVIAGREPALEQLVLPYTEYTDADIAQRVLYVEASRGCPFACAFCLSALDKSVQAFALSTLLGEIDGLYRRGARRFKFVDRTFNVRIEHACAILRFFLDRLEADGDPLFLHFEVVPDRLPERLKSLIARFPPGALQLEVGVQSFDPDVQRRIARRQDNTRSEANLRWLLGNTHAHVHADLIFGLPGESLAGFAAGFDRLQAIGVHEIQVGLLKRLRGAPITRHVAQGAGDVLVFDGAPPYTVSSTGAVSADEVQRVARFARYWDLVANSGRFARTLPLLLAKSAEGEAGDAGPGAGSAFHAFLAFSDGLWQRSGRTHGWSPEALVDALDAYLATPVAREALLADYLASGARGSPQALAGLLPRRVVAPRPAHSLVSRQQRHLAAGGAGGRND